MAEGKFATSVSCMDGRIQIPIDFVDVITEPGIDRMVAENLDLESIKNKVGISINAHKSELIVVSGHYDCAGNPVSDEEHISQIRKGIEVISSWGLNVKVVGIWVDDSWNVKVL
jgi:carbonic anhydrase